MLSMLKLFLRSQYCCDRNRNSVGRYFADILSYIFQSGWAVFAVSNDTTRSNTEEVLQSTRADVRALHLFEMLCKHTPMNGHHVVVRAWTYLIKLEPTNNTLTVSTSDTNSTHTLS